MVCKYNQQRKKFKAHAWIESQTCNDGGGGVTFIYKGGGGASGTSLSVGGLNEGDVDGAKLGLGGVRSIINGGGETSSLSGGEAGGRRSLKAVLIAGVGLGGGS